MSYQTFVVPYLRTSPIHVPRRDLVLGLVDSLALTVQVVDRDSPDAVPLELTGGIGGPVLQMIVWADSWRRATWDYGNGYGYGYGNGWGYGGALPPMQSPWTVLWVGTGVIADAASGTFLISFPTGTMGGLAPPPPQTTWTWPPRCSYALQLDWNGGGETTLLVEGKLHLSRSMARSVAPVIMLTDPTPAALTDPEVNAIFIDGAPP
jgi:hypothetical protein